VIRFGLIGCGGISRGHIYAIGSSEDAVLAAVCDNDAGKAESFGAELDVPYYTDVAELFSSGLIDAVAICAPSGLHAGLCIQAFENDLHVVCEKPLAITRGSLRDVIDAEKKSGKKLTIISQLRYADDIQRVKKIIEEGKLGKMTMVDLSMKYYREPQYYTGSNWRGTIAMDGGGALINQGIHGLDLLRYLCGDATYVRCISKTLVHPLEAEDTLSACFEFANGGLGVLTATTSCFPGQTRRLEISGSEGSLTITEDRLTYLELKNGESLRADLSGDYGTSDPLKISHELHKRQYEDFLASISGDRSTLCNSSEAEKTLDLLFALYEAAAAV